MMHKLSNMLRWIHSYIIQYTSKLSINKTELHVVENEPMYTSTCIHAVQNTCFSTWRVSFPLIQELGPFLWNCFIWDFVNRLISFFDKLILKKWRNNTKMRSNWWIISKYYFSANPDHKNDDWRPWTLWKCITDNKQA